MRWVLAHDFSIYLSSSFSIIVNNGLIIVNSALLAFRVLRRLRKIFFSDTL